MRKECSLCDCSVPNKFIPTYGSGNLNATIAWISSYAPTRKETRQGVFSLDKYIPLTRHFDEYGFSNDNSYFTHIIKCRMTRSPSTLEIHNCVSNLVPELHMLPKLKIIVLIGNNVYKTFIGKSLYKSEYKPIFNGKYVFIGIPHPNFILQNELEYDLSLIKQLHKITVR